MNQNADHIFTRQEAAMAYALSAERIFGKDVKFLDQNHAVLPIFVSLLFQSLEISIKHAGIESELFTENEARQGKMRSGHGIHELANLADEKIDVSTVHPMMRAMIHFNSINNSKEIIRLMVYDDKFIKTRECYAHRNLGYAEVKDGDFAYVDDFPKWIASVKETANNLTKTIDILKQWKKSKSKSSHFAIWLQGQ